MTAAWAAIWLALSSRCGTTGWDTPIWDKLLVLVDGSVESNKPAVCECLREWPLGPPETGTVRGEPVRGVSLLAATWRATAVGRAGGVGREELWRLDVLELGCCVKEA